MRFSTLSIAVATVVNALALPGESHHQTTFQIDESGRHSKNGFPDSVSGESWATSGKDIKTVAIVGAGSTGLIVAKELLDHDFKVRVFERDHSPGGVWYYSEETSPPVRWNESNPQFSDYTPSEPPRYPFSIYASDGYKEARRSFRAPKQVWRDLHSNAPSPLQQITSWPWPAGQPWKNPQWSLGRYLRSFAAFHGLSADEDYEGQGRDSIVSYNTRVENAAKDPVTDKWVLTLKRLVPHGSDGFRIDWWQETSDAVVVASGRYNSPNVPDIPGLGNLIDRFPEHVFHSRNYRVPEPWTNKSVLVIGISISASEISRDIAPVIGDGKLLQSVRELGESHDTNKFPAFDRKFQLRRLPEKAEVVPAVKSIHLPQDAKSVRDAQIQFKNGTVVTGLDGIIFGTGYYYSLPYLPQFHNITAGINDTEFKVAPIVTDGTHLRSLYLDTFYIPDPTLAVVNLNRLVGDWTWGAYQALAVAKYWSNTIDLPPKHEQWRLHFDRVKQRGGYTPTFQFYASLAPDAYRYFIGWLNAAVVKYGGKQVDTLPPERAQIGYYFSAVNWGVDFAASNATRPGYGDQAVHDDDHADFASHLSTSELAEYSEW